MVDRSHKQDGWAPAWTEVPEAASLGEPDAQSRNRKSPKMDLEGKMISMALESEWLQEPISRPTDDWGMIIRGLLIM